ncbi:MAG: hypothetical protein AB1450_08075 [Pseudomonadota bacterium]
MSAPCVRYSTTPSSDAFAIVRYGADASDVSVAAGMLCIDVAMPVLGYSGGNHEVWSTDGPMQHDTVGPLHLVRGDEFIFGAMKVDSTRPLEQASHDTYQLILGVLAAQGYPVPLRMWNYLPRIVGRDSGGERYQLFCSGRHLAFNTAPGYENQLPAASALGSHGPGMVVYFLAARAAGIQVENPQQVSAFHYPRQYGPRSPSFSRAVIMPWGDRSHFYLSGTASVRGHASLHHDDSPAQLQLTLDNITRLLTHGATLHPAAPAGLDAMQLLKVYVRRRADYPYLRAELERRLGANQAVLYLLADVCRTELLLEIEGVGVS